MERCETMREVDVCVAGGGMAGVCAALAAARNGANVALIHDRPVLGGNASSEIRMIICGADWNQPVWRETGILEELRLKSLLHNDEDNVFLQDLALYDTTRSQKGLQVFLNCRVVDCRVTARRVVACSAEELTSNRRLQFTARQFIDATGDGALAFLAGAEYRHGRESRREYGESLAPLEADRFTMGHSILFQAADAGKPVPFAPPSWALKFETDADLPFRPHTVPFGFWWVEWGGTLDTITDTEAIKEELLAVALGVWDHMKNKGDHGFTNYALSWIGFLPGKRESRRFIGDHVLTQDDVMSGRRFADAIAYGGWSIDLHPPEGIRHPGPPTDEVNVAPYDIPLRSCFCRDFENLFLAGRNISATHVAFGSTRVMGTCALIGQGVGTAAAAAVKHGISARQVAEQHMEEVQQTLLADGVYLRGIQNTDAQDLALQAMITASSREGPEFLPENIIDGYNHPEPGISHAWRSKTGLPAWLELRWTRPVCLSRVQIIFDTDFMTRLVLSNESWLKKKNCSAPRSTTVKDFKIQIWAGHEWLTVVSEKDNIQRLVRVSFPPLRTCALRIMVDKTWEVNYASIFEVRCHERK